VQVFYKNNDKKASDGERSMVLLSFSCLKTKISDFCYLDMKNEENSEILAIFVV